MTRPQVIDNPLTGEHVHFLQTADDTGGALLRAEVRLDPGGRVPLHVHARQDETVEVREGTVTVRVGRSEQTLDVGDRASVPRRRPHVVRNAGSGSARFLLEVRPARRMEGAMRGLFATMALLSRVVRRRRPGRGS